MQKRLIKKQFSEFPKKDFEKILTLEIQGNFGRKNFQFVTKWSWGRRKAVSCCAWEIESENDLDPATSWWHSTAAESFQQFVVNWPISGTLLRLSCPIKGKKIIALRDVWARANVNHMSATQLTFTVGLELYRMQKASEKKGDAPLHIMRADLREIRKKPRMEKNNYVERYEAKPSESAALGNSEPVPCFWFLSLRILFYYALIVRIFYRDAKRNSPRI